MSFGQFDSSVIAFAINHQLMSRLAIIGVKPRPADPVWRFLGEAHSSWLDRKHHLNVVGERMENIPDKDYGRWASAFYRDVAGTGQPRFDCVTASIRRDANTYRSRYERLLLPWSTSTDEILVTVSNRRLGEESALPSYAEPDSSEARNSVKSA
jgi:hypothetical protein